jgi:hypothetical protein
MIRAPVFRANILILWSIIDQIAPSVRPEKGAGYGVAGAPFSSVSIAALNTPSQIESRGVQAIGQGRKIELDVANAVFVIGFVLDLYGLLVALVFVRLVGLGVGVLGDVQGVRSGCCRQRQSQRGQ